MRCIDADALIDDLKHDVAMDQDSLDYEELTDSNRENIQFDKDCKQNAIDLLQHAPTIEQERKKGRWIPLQLSIAYPPYQCSCCFRNAPMIETGCLMNRHLEALLTDFCPNCGADMRGKGEK